MTADAITIRKCSPADGPALLSLILALAAYEKLDPPDAAAQQRLIRDLGGDRPRYEAYLAELNARPVGYTFIFETYSSFLALPTFYLEDFFVLPEERGKKIGLALFRGMVREAHRRGCGRMEWAVLDWNRLAIDFYERAGARQLNEWKYYRLTRSDMERVLA